MIQFEGNELQYIVHSTYFKVTELYFLADSDTPILQTDASDYGIGGYLYTIRDEKVRVVHFFSKALVGAQLNWSAGEKECYGLYYGVKLFEVELDGRYFILSNGFSQSEHPVFSLRRALIMPRRETGNIHSPTADVRHDHPGQIYNHHGSERGIQSDRIVGDSHKESRRTTILRYFPDLYYGHWSDTFLYATYVRTPSPLR